MLNIAIRPQRLVFAALMLFALAVPATAQTIDTAGRQALLVDFDTGTVLLEKNADELMPPSSMSKLMTAYLVFEKLKEGKLKMTDMLPVTERAWRKQGSKMFVALGSQVKVEDLLRGVIVQSGNDACIVLAEGIAGSEEAFAEMATKRARELGLNQSVFKNATGWPDPGHVMTARDLSVLARRIITDFPDYYHIYSELNFTYNGIKQGNRNPLLYKNIGADGLKTGHTEAAGYGLTASVKRGDRRLILVINGLNSMNQRSDETERLIEWGFREFENYTLVEAGQPITEAEVWLGETATVPLVPANKAVATLPRAARKDMKVTAIYDGPVAAPIAKGQQVGKLVVTAPSLKQPQEIPLIAGADVPRLGFFGRVMASAKHLVLGGS